MWSRQRCGYATFCRSGADSIMLLSSCDSVASSQPWSRKQLTEYPISARRPSTVVGLVRTSRRSARASAAPASSHSASSVPVTTLPSSLGDDVIGRVDCPSETLMRAAMGSNCFKDGRGGGNLRGFAQKSQAAADGLREDDVRAGEGRCF